MEDHILTDHSDIFRSASDSLDGSQIEESPKRIERKEKVKTSEDLESEIEIKFGWVILDGKVCSKCSFIATDQSLINDHLIEKHQETDKNEEWQTAKVSNFEQKCQDKRKKCPGVNFITILRANFSYKHRFSSFSLVTCT